MPWCPECRTEYRPEIDRCADCGAELVEAPPEPRVSPSLTSLRRLLGFVGDVAIAGLVQFVALMPLVPLVAWHDHPGPLPWSTRYGILCLSGLCMGTCYTKPSLGRDVLRWAMLPLGFFFAAMMASILLGPAPDRDWALTDLPAGAAYFIELFVLAPFVGAFSSFLGSRWRSDKGNHYLYVWLVFCALTAVTPFLVAGISGW